MAWVQNTTRLALVDRPIEVLGCVIGVQDEVRFRTKEFDATGRVLGIDHGAVHPIRLEFETLPGGDKRIVNFAPGEFININRKD